MFLFFGLIYVVFWCMWATLVVAFWCAVALVYGAALLATCIAAAVSAFVEHRRQQALPAGYPRGPAPWLPPIPEAEEVKW